MRMHMIWSISQLRTNTTSQGVEVTLLDANHCPGAVQILFRLPLASGGAAGAEKENGANTSKATTNMMTKKRPVRPWEGGAAKGASGGGAGLFKTILHTGDCRASPGMVAAAVAWLRGLREREGGGAGGASSLSLVDTLLLDTTYCDPKVCVCW